MANSADQTPQGLDRILTLELVRVTERAAVAAARLRGRGDEKAADQVAVDAMRKELNRLPISGTVVIGEGERDEAPMLYIGEEVGTRNGSMKLTSRLTRWKAPPSAPKTCQTRWLLLQLLKKATCFTHQTFTCRKSLLVRATRAALWILMLPPLKTSTLWLKPKALRSTKSLPASWIVRATHA